jgi:uncharacterized protein (DUF433 family)
MAKEARARLQVDLSPRHQLLLGRLRSGLGGSDAEAARRVMEMVESAADRIEQGFKMVAVPIDDEHPDAMPELTRAVRPEMRYDFLVQRPHPWRKQLVLKGRRLTVGQLLGTMRVEGWSPERAADEYDLPTAAVLEAIDYGERNAALIRAENAEDARAAKSLHAPAPR